MKKETKAKLLVFVFILTLIIGFLIDSFKGVALTVLSEMIIIALFLLYKVLLEMLD